MIRFKGNFNDEVLNLAKIHGPIFTSWISSEPSIVITDLEIAKEAFLEKKNEIAGRPQFDSCSFDVLKFILI